MIRLSKERASISVVDDQIGSPTYGIDLAQAIMKIIVDHNKGLVSDKVWCEIYNFSNRGAVTWYDFANGIFQNIKSEVILKSIPSVLYPTPARRPEWSVLDTQKIENAFNIKIIDWNVSLMKCISNLVN